MRPQYVIYAAYMLGLVAGLSDHFPAWRWLGYASATAVCLWIIATTCYEKEKAKP